MAELAGAVSAGRDADDVGRFPLVVRRSYRYLETILCIRIDKEIVWARRS